MRQLGIFACTKSAYCEARKRLSLDLLRALLRETGQRLTHHARDVRLWRRHRVVSVDGSTIWMSDTQPLRVFFHWSSDQRGFELPVSRFVALFDLITSALLDLSQASMRDHEVWIVQRLHNLLRPSDEDVAACRSWRLSHKCSGPINVLLPAASE